MKRIILGFLSLILIMSNPIAMRTSADLRFDDNNLYLICDMVYLDNSVEIEGFWELDSAYNEDGEPVDTPFSAAYINEGWYYEYYQEEFTLYPHVVIGGMLYALYDDNGVPAAFRVYLLENGMICTRFLSSSGYLIVLRVHCGEKYKRISGY